ncbi:MAG: hypothetical protein J6V44_03610 [Methanobrevibacter sp.]|nr:hypothetical protein [Methanobrevibacter sp.]
MNKKEGCEWLESHVTIHNLLVKAQEVDEELEKCSIQLMDGSYYNEDMEEVNRIYIVRGKTQNMRKNATINSHMYIAHIEIIIRTSKFDVPTATRTLNSLARCVDAYINISNIGAFCYLYQIVPMYDNNGLLHEYRLVYYCHEVQELENYPKLCKNLELFLKITSSIRGENEIQRDFPLSIDSHEEDKLFDYDNIPFGGG